MNKILFPLLLLAGMWASFPLAGQQLTINGTVHIEGESAENATLEILKNGQIIERKTMTNGATSTSASHSGQTTASPSAKKDTSIR